MEFTLFDPEEALRKAAAFEEVMEHGLGKPGMAGLIR